MVSLLQTMKTSSRIRVPGCPTRLTEAIPYHHLGITVCSHERNTFAAFSYKDCNKVALPSPGIMRLTITTNTAPRLNNASTVNNMSVSLNLSANAIAAEGSLNDSSVSALHILYEVDHN